jgi:GTP-binding protein
LLHLIDGTEEDVVAAYRTVRGELEAYGHDLTDKPEIIALNKIDALTPEVVAEKRAALSAAAGRTVLAISGVSQSGVRGALGLLWREIAKARGILEPDVQDNDVQGEPMLDGSEGGWTP